MATRFYRRAFYMIKMIFLETTILLLPGGNFLLDPICKCRMAECTIPTYTSSAEGLFWAKGSGKLTDARETFHFSCFLVEADEILMWYTYTPSPSKKKRVMFSSGMRHVGQESAGRAHLAGRLPSSGLPAKVLLLWTVTSFCFHYVSTRSCLGFQEFHVAYNL